MVLIGCKKKFVPAIQAGDKTQTIRKNRKRNPEAGDRLQLYCGLRTKHTFKILESDPDCIESSPIKFWWENHTIQAKLILPGERKMGRGRLRALAVADGFPDGIQGLEEFFFDEIKDGSDFDGRLIRWRAVDLYRPSNGTEGSCWENAWCEQCRRFAQDPNRAQCKIWMESMIGNTQAWRYVDDPDSNTGRRAICEGFKPKTAPKKCNKYKRREAQGQTALTFSDGNGFQSVGPFPEPFPWFVTRTEAGQVYHDLEQHPTRPQLNMLDTLVKSGSMPADQRAALTY